MHGLKSHWVTPQRHQCLCASFHQWPAAEVWRQVKTRPWLFQTRICRKSFVSSCFLLVGWLHPQQLLCWTLQLQHHTTMPGCPAVWALMPILPRLYIREKVCPRGDGHGTGSPHGQGQGPEPLEPRECLYSTFRHTVWFLSAAMCSQGIGHNDLYRSLPTQDTPWFYSSPFPCIAQPHRWATQYI